MSDLWSNVQATQPTVKARIAKLAVSAYNAELGGAMVAQPAPDMPPGGYTGVKVVDLPLIPQPTAASRTAQLTTPFGARDEYYGYVDAVRSLTLTGDYHRLIGDDIFEATRSAIDPEQRTALLIQGLMKWEANHVDTLVCLQHASASAGNTIRKGTTNTPTAFDYTFINDLAEALTAKVGGITPNKLPYVILARPVFRKLLADPDVAAAMNYGNVQDYSPMASGRIPILFGIAIFTSPNIVLTGSYYEQIGGVLSTNPGGTNTFEFGALDLSKTLRYAGANVVPISQADAKDNWGNDVPLFPGAGIARGFVIEDNTSAMSFLSTKAAAVRDLDSLFKFRTGV